MESLSHNALILLIDDDLKNLQLAGKFLEKNGFRVSLAQSGTEAENVLGKVYPDLILLDVMMPDITGFELCKKLKKRPDLQEIPILFLTLKNELEDIVEGFKVGGADFIGKPFEKDELLSRIKTHLEVKFSREHIIKHQQEIQALLENLGQGFMIFNKDGVILPGSTKVVEEFFKINPTGNDFSEVLQMTFDEKENFKKWCHNVWGGRINFKDLVSLAPRSFEKIPGRFFELEYRPIYKKNNPKILDKVICIASDKTKEREFQLKVKDQQEKGITYNLILTNTIDFLDLVTDAQDHFWDLGVSLEDDKEELNLENLYRKIHTLKARFSQFKMVPLVKSAHQFETFLSNLQTNKTMETDKREKCINHLNNLIQLLGKFQIENKGLLELANKVFFLEEGNFKTVRISTMKDFIKNEVGETSQCYLHFKEKFILSPLDQRFRGYSNLIHQVSSSQGKEVCFEVKESSIRVDLDFYDDFFASCIHLFRNAIDHGLETIEERENQNKASVGRITVETKAVGEDHFKIMIEDDGRGVNPERIKREVLEKKKRSKNDLDKMTDFEAIQLIFLQGISSREKVDEISGRGIGLEALKYEVEKMGGDIKVESTLGEKTLFTITLPLCV